MPPVARSPRGSPPATRAEATLQRWLPSHYAALKLRHLVQMSARDADGGAAFFAGLQNLVFAKALLEASAAARQFAILARGIATADQGAYAALTTFRVPEGRQPDPPQGTGL